MLKYLITRVYQANRSPFKCEAYSTITAENVVIQREIIYLLQLMKLSKLGNNVHVIPCLLGCRDCLKSRGKPKISSKEQSQLTCAIEILFLLFFIKFLFFLQYDSPSKTIKNVFHFTEKALFVLETFKFLKFYPSFPHFPD